MHIYQDNKQTKKLLLYNELRYSDGADCTLFLTTNITRNSKLESLT